jgi:hypothetical protein
MKKTIIRFFKRLYINMLILNRKYSYDANQPVSQTQKMSMSIAKKLIKHPESKFDIGPKSGKKYITNSELKLFIIFDKRVLSITNHVYHYDIILTDRNWDKIIKMYDAKVEEITQEYEDQIMYQIEHSLEKIIKKVEYINDLTSIR